MIVGEHVGGSQTPSIPPDPTSDSGVKQNCEKADLKCQLRSTQKDNPSSLTPELRPNPPLGPLIVIGILVTLVTVPIEVLIVKAEMDLALADTVAPQIGVPLGITLAVVGATVLDFEVSYWAYVYRVYSQPDIHQDYELFPPWGFR